MIPVIILSIVLIWAISIRSPLFQLRYSGKLIEYAQKLNDKLTEIVQRMEKEMSPEEFKKFKEEYAKKHNIDLDDFS